MSLKLEKYSLGIGDRFGLQGEAQLSAISKAKEGGINISPVWNKSFREHQIIGTSPADVRIEADNAVKTLNHSGPYYVDADHINNNTVDNFIEPSDFFTLDVADYIGEKPKEEDLNDFLSNNEKCIGELYIPGIENPFHISKENLREIGSKYIVAVKEAASIYKKIKESKSDFIAELSMDEVDDPQTPIDLFFILGLAAQYEIPIQTIAPKFSGSFYKGIDYVGNTELFRTEFEQDLLVIDYAIQHFGLPDNLKLSVHSGSDKFSIYPIMGELIKKHDKGIHVKTAGTTWLEEVIGLALTGSKGLHMAKKIYKEGFIKIHELMKPYKTVINIDLDKLPLPELVNEWSGQKFANTLRHIPDHPDYNPHFRQLIHIAYKVVVSNFNEYQSIITNNKEIVEQQVFENIYDRHIRRLFY